MSGIFIAVSDGDDLNSKVLHTTSGGHPHITLFYSGANVPKKALVEMAPTAFVSIVEALPSVRLLPENAKRNIFFHDGQGATRYDVLLHLTDADKEIVNRIRTLAKLHLEEHELDIKENTLSMGDPHITHSIHWNEAEARASLEAVQAHLPLEVQIVGFTID